MSRPSKPRPLKLIAGSRRPDVETVPLPTVDHVPAAPDWLPNAHAVKEWDRLAPMLHANGLLTNAGLSALAMLCAVFGKLVQMWTAGESPPGNLMGVYRLLCGDFGLTPAAQSRVRPASDPKEANPFAANGRRPNKGKS